MSSVELLVALLVMFLSLREEMCDMFFVFLQFFAAMPFEANVFVVDQHQATFQPFQLGKHTETVLELPLLLFFGI